MDETEKEEKPKHHSSDVVVVEKPCDRQGGVSNTDKWIISAIIAVIFIILASPFTFKITNWIFSYINLPTITKEGKPTFFGLIIHGIIFFLVIRLLMH